MAKILEVETLPKVSGPFLPAADLKTRLQQEHETLECIRCNGERWPKGLGYYNDTEHALINQLQIVDDRTHPPTFHGQLKGFIDRLRRVSNSDKPIVLLDLGGGAGSTWCINATQFEADIKKGQVVFVVSNLAWSPDQFLAEGQKQKENFPEMAHKGRRLVQFINSTFRELRDRFIVLPNGKKVSLKNSVDLIHESRSLTSWSHVPELDIPAIIELLSPFGSYFVAPLDTPIAYKKDDQTEKHQRESAVRNTYDLLQKGYGLHRITRVEKGGLAGAELLYRVFRKQQAPKIEI